MHRYNLIITCLGCCLMGANTQHLLIINEVIQRTIQVMPTQIDQFPILAQVLKYYFESKQYQQQCAGVILTSYHVLSAAHCFPVGMDVRNWMICVGSSYRSSGGVLHNVKAIKVHEKYDKAKNTNDIAIVEVTNPFTFNSNVRQARILSYGSEISPNSACTLVGWGALKRYGPQPEQLKLTNVVTIDQCDCIRRYGTIGRIIRNSMICAIRIDGRQSAACKGDSGGPLIYNGVVVGLVSFGVWCQNPDYPAVYTKVSYYTEWIKRTTSVI